MLGKRLANLPLNRDVGLLVLRLGVGLSMLVFHGWDKITAGPETWEKVGGGMSNLGITFAPAFWGFLAAFAEAVGSALLVVGLLFRPAALMLAFTMLVAILHHVSMPEGALGAGWKAASHAVELLAIYTALLLTGSGRFAFQWGSGSRSE